MTDRRKGDIYARVFLFLFSVSARMRKIQSKNKGARVVTRLFIYFFRRSKAANSVGSNGILIKFNLIQAFMVVLVSCKNQEDSFKNEGEWSQHFSHHKSMEMFLEAQGQLNPQPEV